MSYSNNDDPAKASGKGRRAVGGTAGVPPAGRSAAGHQGGRGGGPSERPWVRPAALLLLAACTGAAVAGPWAGKPGPAAVPWPELQAAAAAEERRADLPAGLLLALAQAESSLRPHAANGRARGLLQLTPVAWREVTDQPFRQAWHWRANLTAAADYLAALRTRLRRAGRDRLEHLAGAYRHGFGGIAARGFDPASYGGDGNQTYAALFAGRLPSVLAPPHPERYPGQGGE